MLSLDCFSLGFNGLDKYKHLNVKQQFDEYNSIYTDTLRWDDDTHLKGLAQILSQRAFPLWKDFINDNNIGDNSNKEQALEHLEILYNFSLKLIDHEQLSRQNFWFINMAAAVIIDTYKGIICAAVFNRDYPVYDKEVDFIKNLDLIDLKKKSFWVFSFKIPTFIYAQGVFNQINNPDYFRLQVSNPYIIYTNNGSGLSIDTFLRYAKENKCDNILTVFNCTLRPMKRSFSKENKYLPHYGMMSTSSFLGHDLAHSRQSNIDCWKELKFMIDITSVNPQELASNDLTLVKNALFILLHEFDGIIQYYKEIAFSNDFFRSRAYEPKLTGFNYLSDLGPYIFNIIEMLEKIAQAKAETDSFKKIDYGIYAKDFETSLKARIPTPKTRPSARFFAGSLKDVLGQPLIPSLPEVLTKENEEEALNEWKQLNEQEKASIKADILNRAYIKFWHSFIIIILEHSPELIIAEEFIEDFNTAFKQYSIREIYGKNPQIFMKFLEYTTEINKHYFTELVCSIN